MFVEYSASEEFFIRESWGRLTAEEIAVSLGRTVNGVRQKAYWLGLRSRGGCIVDVVGDEAYMRRCRAELDEVGCCD